MRLHLRLPLAALAALMAACGRADPVPPAPAMTASETPISVRGTEKVEWDQPGAVREQLSKYRFIGYVDGVPADLPDASCAMTPVNGKFPCSARIPKMTPGRHRFELAAEEIEEPHRRGTKSGALVLDVRPADTTSK